MIEYMISGSTPLLLVLSLTCLYPFFHFVWNVYLHPISKIPGPKLWAAFRLRYCYSLWRGSLVHDINAIHDEYGSIVRVAPNEVSVARGDGWKDIYCRRPGHKPFPKNPIWWGEIPGRVPSIVSTPDPVAHERMRTLLSTCFTPQTLKAQEPAITFHLDNLIEQLRKLCVSRGGSTIVCLNDWFTFLVFDIVGDLGFGESFRCLDSNALHPWVAELFSYSKLGALVAALRHYGALFKLIMWCVPASTMEAANANYNWGVEKTRRRLELGTEREDFIGQILRFKEQDELSMDVPEIVANMNLLIQAGSDTCSLVLSGTINYLVKTPQVLQTLENEIRSRYNDSCETSFESLDELPYLAAVVEEGLRVCPPNPQGLHHIVPVGGDTVCGHWLPAGTHVSVHQQSLYRSPQNFYEPNAFVPERWLISAQTDTSSPYYHDNRDAVQSYGTGSWSCIGKTLAYAELKSTLAKLILTFNIRAAPGGRDVDWIKQRSFAMMEKLPFDVELTYRF